MCSLNSIFLISNSCLVSREDYYMVFRILLLTKLGASLNAA